jgi:hypothetical protein
MEESVPDLYWKLFAEYKKRFLFRNNPAIALRRIGDTLQEIYTEPDGREVPMVRYYKSDVWLFMIRGEDKLLFMPWRLGH